MISPHFSPSCAVLSHDIPIMAQPLRPLQRVLLTTGSAVGALVNPYRGDLVATLGETTGTAALTAMRDKMRMSTTGLEILKERPRITPETMDLSLSLYHSIMAHGPLVTKSPLILPTGALAWWDNFITNIGPLFHSLR
eukprot:sb/3474428/